jgi:ribose transport system ATP-binding protein
MGELIGLSHRVAVMCVGVLTGVLDGEQINEQEIMQYASGIKGVGVDEQRHG